MTDDLIQLESPGSRLTGAPDETPQFDEIRHGFELAGQHFLLPGGLFSELAAKAQICPLPDSPPWFAGFINHRGHTVPVYDLPYMTHQERTDLREPYWILLLDQQPHTAGFLLSQIPTVVFDPAPIDELDTDLSVPKPLQPFLSGQFRAQDKIWSELNHRELLKKLKKVFYQPAALFE